MSVNDEPLWSDIRSRCETLTTGAELMTPYSERPFRVTGILPDRVQVRFADSNEERTLWRDQFEILTDRLKENPLTIDDLPPSVEPYATILTLLATYRVDDNEIRTASESETETESPYFVSPAAARTRPERLHDDALLLANLLDTLETVDPETLETDTLTDLYVLLSDVQHEADRLRQVARESLLGRIGPNQKLHGTFGTVRQTSRERRYPKDTETVFDALDHHEIPREWVLGVDRDKLDIVLAVTALDEDEVYNIDEQVYIQKTEVEQEEKYSRLQGLADRITELEDAEERELQADLLDLEARLEEALSA